MTLDELKRQRRFMYRLAIFFTILAVLVVLIGCWCATQFVLTDQFLWGATGAFTVITTLLLRDQALVMIREVEKLDTMIKQVEARQRYGKG